MRTQNHEKIFLYFPPNICHNILIVQYPFISQLTNIENALFLHQNIFKMPLYHMKALSFEESFFVNVFHLIQFLSTTKQLEELIVINGYTEKFSYPIFFIIIDVCIGSCDLSRCFFHYFQPMMTSFHLQMPMTMQIFFSCKENLLIIRSFVHMQVLRFLIEVV